MKAFLLILLLMLCYCPQRANAEQPKPYVILISFDGFRWDYANREVTPNLEIMRTRGVSALSLEPAFPTKTFPNHLSIVTGMYPQNHGIIWNDFLDRYSGRWYRLGDSAAVEDSRWYLGEAFWETAERQGIRTASYFWPGSELELGYRRPTYVEKYDHQRPAEKKIAGVINWLQFPQAQRPHFITMYFHETDDAGHRGGPDSPEATQAAHFLDGVLGRLFAALDSIQMLDSTDIIVVSDHGMTNVDTVRVVNVEQMLADFPCKLMGNGPVMMVDCSEEQMAAVYTHLKQNARHYQVYYRSKMPGYFHYSQNPFISPIVMVAEMGWSLETDATFARLRKYARNGKGGNHGYDNHHLDMHGIFFAMGPHFREGYRTGTLRNIDIYPLLCKIFGIIPRQNIDGRLEAIGFVLNDR